MKPTSEFFSKEVIEFLRKEIEENFGNELFAIGKYDEEKGLILEIEIIARGTEECTLAFLDNKEQIKPEILIHNHPSGILMPSKNDLEFSYKARIAGRGSCIINNDVTFYHTIVEIPKKEKIYTINNDIIEEILTQKARQVIDKYEFREQQLTMSLKINEEINNGNIFVVEAGTGTGKSIAYLIPSILWGLANKKRIVISTNTINLQQQLIEKDIPLTRKLLELNFFPILLKGRQNYLCLRRLNNYKDFNENDENNKIIQAIFEWSKDTKTGDKVEFTNIIPNDIWIHICSDSDFCMNKSCYFFDNCYYTKIKLKLSTADIIITNHHLLFADIQLKSESSFKALIPYYDLVVIDEAHNIEDVSTSYFGFQFSKFYLIKLIYFIGGTKKKSIFQKQLQKFLESISGRIDEEKLYELNENYNSIFSMQEKIINLYIQLEEKILEIWDEEDKYNTTIDIKILLKNRKSNELTIKKCNFMTSFKNFIEYLSSIHKILSKIKTIFISGIIFDLEKYVEKLKSYVDMVNEFFITNDNDFIYWIEKKKEKETNNYFIIFNKSPIDITKYLQNYFYTKIPHIIMTSATLTVDKSFDFFYERVGLPSNVKSLLLPSPFDYNSQMFLGVINDILTPDNENFKEDIAPIIKEFIEISKGRAFVLFTSYKLMKDVYNKIKDYLHKLGINIYIQGEDINREYMLEKFIHDINSVLFGTNSFWEGVDVPGESLSMVIITKLPFKVPTHPLELARRELITKQGRNSFLVYDLPKAVIKFKQGVGRLIRKKTDFGAVIIFDCRVASKWYGKYFLNSLDKTNPEIDNTKNLYIKTKKFFENFEALKENLKI